MIRGFGFLGYGPGWFISALMMLLFWVAVVILVIWLVRQFSERKPASGGRALEILDERYARGEIDREDYLARRSDLTPG